MEIMEAILPILKEHGIWSLIIVTMVWATVYVVRYSQIEYKDGKVSFKFPRSKK